MAFMSGLDTISGSEGLGGGQWAKDEDRSYGNNGNQTYDEWMQSQGAPKGSYGNNDAFIQWRQENTPEGQTFVYNGNQYTGTKSKPEVTESVSESNKETVEPEGVDYSWVTSAEDVTSSESSSTKADGITGRKENGYDLDVYLFAKGMLDGNKNDDEGNPMGWYGNVETLKSKKEKYDKDHLDGPNYDKFNKAIKAYQRYVDTYKEDYEKDVNKSKYENFAKVDKTEYNKANEEADNAKKEFDEAAKAWAEANGGMYEYDDPDAITKYYNDIIKKVTAIQDKVNNDAIYNATKNGTLSGKYYSQKGYEVDIKWDSTGLKNLFSGGSKLGTATIGNRTYDIVRTNEGELGDAVVQTDEKGTPQVALSGFSTNAGENEAHQNAIPVAVVNITNKVALDALERGTENPGVNDEIKSAYNEMSNSLLKAKQAYQKVNDARENAYNAVTRSIDAEVGYNKAQHEAARKAAQEATDAYARGEISAFEAANRLANIQDTKISFNMHDIVSNVDVDKDVLGRLNDSVVSKGAVEYDLSNPSNPITERMVSEIYSLVELRQEVDNIDTSSITDVASAEKAVKSTNEIASQYATVANDSIKQLVTDMLKTGADLQSIRDSKNFKKLSQQIFNDSQAIYDKVSEIEARSREKNILGLSEEEIKANKNVVQAVVNRFVGNPEDKQTLDKEGIEALAKYTSSIQSTKDAALALMKSAAFNGAENSEGAIYSERWKIAKNIEAVPGFNPFSSFRKEMINNAKAEGREVLTNMDVIATAAKGVLGTVAVSLGVGLATVNPPLGALLIAAGAVTTTKSGVTLGMYETRSHSTNAEVMFENSNSNLKNVFNDIYNRTENPANVGDPHSVGTYVNATAGMIEISQGIINLIINPAEGLMLIADGVDSMRKVVSGGLSGNLDTTIQNVYDLGENINKWSKMEGIDVNDFMYDPKSKVEFINNEKDPREWQETTKNGKPIAKDAEADYAQADFGTTTTVDGDPNSTIDDKYSGYKEQAKNSNLAKNYNYGMEQNVNEAVSDKDVKGYIVTLYSKEPKWMRKAIDKVLATHSEREW